MRSLLKPEQKPQRPLDALAEDFLRLKRPDLADPETFEARLRNHALQALGRHTAATLLPMHVKDMMQSVVASGLSPQTANHVRDGGRQLVEFAIDNGEWPAANPFTKVRPLKVPIGEKVMLTKDQTRQLMLCLRRALVPLFAVAIYLGARRDTIFSIRRTDVDLSRGLIQLKKTKTGKQILNVPIPEELRPYLRDALFASVDSDWLFPSRYGGKRTRDSGRYLNREILRALKGMGVVNEAGEPLPLTFKGLRRLSASLHQEAGAAPWVVSRVLGHSQAALVAAGNPAENMTARHYTIYTEEYVRQELNKLRFHGV
jgi:integrase